MRVEVDVERYDDNRSHSHLASEDFSVQPLWSSVSLRLNCCRDRSPQRHRGRTEDDRVYFFAKAPSATCPRYLDFLTTNSMAQNLKPLKRLAGLKAVVVTSLK